MTSRKNSRPPARAALVRTVTAALEDMKAVNIKVLDVRGITDVADCMVIASGNSDRHVRSIADRVVERAKAEGFRPFGVEGQQDAEWVLVDLNDVIVHVMLPRVREFYGLESLWESTPKAPRPATARRSAAKSAAKTAAKAKAAGRRTAVAAPSRGKPAPARPAARKGPVRRPGKRGADG